MPSSRDEELFADALNQSPKARAAFLARACGEDLELLAKLAALLVAHEAPESLTGNTSPSGPATREEGPGDWIGRYKLLQRIGEGGCGLVYLAEQEQPLRRRVALKVIKLGMDTKEVIARFEVERQALALMDHPHIAKVHDAGATEAGRPFFVMELVRGVPITTYCDEQSLPTGERLKLFAQVCHAIQHAHQKGIIHRDLKPSNILVALHDGVPVPKVIDFGIAKATAGRLTDEPLFTAFEHFIGTPTYMSPEQAQISALDIDTRSDIYSLGVLLYELLTGHTPFDPKQLMKVGLDEIRRHIREVEPVRPSTRLSTLQGDALGMAAQRRQTAAPKLIKLVQGDLDWIVMRCLEKDRSRRYETANGLADDVERHLRHEAIAARPPSAAYKLRKFVRRNRLSFIAVAAVSVALIMGTIVSAMQAVRANRAEQVASREASISRAVNEFLLTDLLQQADSRTQAESKTTPNPNLKVRDALDRAANNVGKRFSANPTTEAAVREAIGLAYDGLGEYGKSEEQHRRALELRQRALGPRHPDTLGSMNASALSLHFQGKSAEAESLHRHTLSLRREILGPEHPDTLASLNNLGLACYSQAKHDAAAIIFAESLAVRRKLLGEEHPQTLRSMNNLANAYRAKGMFAESAVLLEKTVAIRKRVEGVQHPFTLSSMNNLALSYHLQGKYKEAIELNRETLELRRRTLGPEHPDTLSSTNNLALNYAAEGKFTEAATLHGQAWEIYKRVLGTEHPSTLSSMNNLANALYGANKPAEAHDLLVANVESRKRVLGPDHPHTLLSMNNLGNTYCTLGKLAESTGLLAQVLETRKRVLGTEHPETLVTMHDLAAAHRQAGQVSDATRLLEEALRIRTAKLGPEHTDTKKTLADLRLVQEKAGRRVEP